MAIKTVYPAVNAYIADLCAIADNKSVYGADVSADKELICSLSTANAAMYAAVAELKGAIAEVENITAVEESSKFCAYRILPLMEKVRAFADGMERETAKEYWPMPDYLDILFSVE